MAQLGRNAMHPTTSVAVSLQCDVLTRAAQHVSYWCNKQPAVKEESLTDWLLFQISEELRNVTYRAFNRHEEARVTGADWEWWFVFRSGSYKFRVQAKKLKTTADNYPSVSYSNDHGMQIDKLIQDANREDAVPLYAFFYGSVGSSPTKCGAMVKDVGVAVVNAHTIHESFIAPPRTFINATDILAETVPLSCLVCCPSRTKVGLERFAEFVREYLSAPATQDSTSLTTTKDVGYHEDTPEYVLSLVEGSQDIGPWWDEQFAADIVGIKAIIVHDLRNLVDSSTSAANETTIY
jgi:hypothetical protein